MVNMTPKECFSGKKPKVGHFRIFGSLTYSHVPSEKRTKLEPTAEKGIIVSYSETSKAWIYFPKRNDGAFDRFQEFKAIVENQTWKKIKVLRSNNKGEYTPMISETSVHQ